MALTKVGKEGITGIDNSSDATAITINSSETVMIGRTSTGYSNTGAQFTASGAQNIFVADGDFPLGLNRQTDDGVILDVRKDGTTVGSVNSASGDLHIGTGDAGLRFYDAGPAIYPRDTSGNDEDGTVDLGLSSARFKDIYLSGGVNFSANSNASGMTSELLDDYEEGTWTPSFSDLSNTPTYHLLTGKYTKIGRQVMVQLSMQSNASPTFNNNDNVLAITGLPFAIDAVGYVSGVGAVSKQTLSYNGSNNNSNVTGEIVAIANTSEQINFQVSTSGGLRGNVKNVGATGGFIIELTLFYTGS